MRLSALRLQNFRSCKDVTIQLDPYTCLVGPNGAGKSTVLTALNILFRNTAGAATNLVTLSEEDFCNRDPNVPIVISATFVDLSDEAKEDFKLYVRQNQLVITARAEWRAELRAAEVKQFGARMVAPEFAPFFEGFGSSMKVGDLKELYNGYRSKHSELPSVSVKAEMELALRNYEEAHPEMCELLDGEHQFYGWSKGSNRLAKYVQWVYIPAVKDASAEQDEARNTALGELLQRTIRTQLDFDQSLAALKEETIKRYNEIVDSQQEALASLSKALEGRLHQWAHPGARVELKWNTEGGKQVSVVPPLARAAVGEHDFVGEVARLGHGMQRAFIVSVLQELASSGDGNAPTLILGFEEPELYQHPPQARHLARVLEELSAKEAQVVVTTHSPYFISGKGFESVRMVRKRAGANDSVITQVRYAELSARIAKAMGEEPRPASSLMAAVEQILQPSQSELFFCGCPIIVEGTEDIAFLATQLQLADQWSAFRRFGCHFIVAEGKNKLSRPLALAQLLGLPTFVVFDGDYDRVKNNQIAENERDNGCILRLCGSAAPPRSSATVWEENLVMWSTRIADELIAEAGAANWDKAENEAKKTHALTSDVQRKNGVLVAATVEQLWRSGVRPPSLAKICDSILAFAKKQQPLLQV